jgi:hypothetical protein
MRAFVLGSILTRQYRFATRGIDISLRTAQQVVGVAGDVVGAVAGHFGLGNGHRDRDPFDTEVMPEPTPAPAPAAPPASKAPPPPPVASAPTPAATPPAPAPAATRPAPPDVVAPPAPPEPSHVSSEPELVRESAEPGAEDGAGAQIRIEEPWPGYRSFKARDIVARLPSATREELAAVELFERAGANRKSVIAAAQRALKKASPPR